MVVAPRDERKASSVVTRDECGAAAAGRVCERRRNGNGIAHAALRRLRFGEAHLKRNGPSAAARV